MMKAGLKRETDRVRECRPVQGFHKSTKEQSGKTALQAGKPAGI